MRLSSECSLTSGTDSGSLNSMYAIPLKRFVLLHVINRMSRTLPTLEKNSSKSRDRIRCDSCMQKTVRASRSSGLRSSGGERSPKPFGGVRPRRNGRGDGERCLKIKSKKNLVSTLWESNKKNYFFGVRERRLGERRRGDLDTRLRSRLRDLLRFRSFDRLRL